ncbi:phosphoglycerate dehydrogenase [Candidatus Nitrospira salsa]|nr:MAG: 2-hydroxyacid dehydrogenase [Nitrospirales bacterium]
MPADTVIAVTSSSFASDSYLREQLLHFFPNSLLNCEKQKLSREALIKFLKPADGIILGTDQVDAQLLESCPRLQFVSKYGVGMDNIDRAACEARGVHIGWTGGVNRLSVAEQVLGFMLSLCRNLYQSSVKLKTGTWEKQGGAQLSGKTIGIVGLGHIGKELVRLLQPFSCRILVNDIIDQSAFCLQYALEKASLTELVSESNIVTIHTPLTTITRHLVNLDLLSCMKPNAFLINTSRGGVVNQQHLKESLRKGLIAGAAIDVYEDEPASDPELLELPNVFCTPHIGGNSKEAIRAMGCSAIEHVKTFFQVNES